MLETRSASYKMMKTIAPADRRIERWPRPFSLETTSYDEEDFNILVKHACIAKDLTLRICKVIIIGDVAVGKTSLVNRFCHKIFENNYKATIGVDFEVERFDILGVPFHLQIWDTAGQERFKCIAASYYRGANAVVVVFDLGNLMSLRHCQQWLNEATRGGPGPSHILLVGTKKDLLSDPVYNTIEMRAVNVARRMGAEYWAVSSRSDDGVRELFTRIAALSFNATVLREIQSIRTEPLSIGTDVITLKSRSPGITCKHRNVPKCVQCLA